MAGTNWADFTPVDNDAPTAVDWSQFEVIPKANAAQRMLDIGKSFASGGVGATKAIADAGGASNAVSKRLGGAQDALQDMLSPERQAERAMRAKTIADAEQSGSTLREVGAHLGGFAEAPISTIAEAAGSVVPVVASMFTPVGRRAGARAALSLGLGAAQGAGSVKGSIYDAVQQKHVEQGATPEAAQQAAEKAQAYSGPNLDSIGVGAVLGAVAGRSGVESTVNRIIGGKAAMGGQSVLRRAAVGTVAEGLPEAAQGGQERLSSNLALQKEGFEMPTWQGVAGQAASEGLAGGVLGGGINAASRGHARPAAQPGAPVNLDDPSVGVDSAAPPAIDPAAGPLSKAAAMAVDNGAGPAMPESTWTADTAGNVMTGEQRKAGVALADAAALVTPAPISELAAMVENLPVDVRRDARFTLKELQRQDLPAGVRAFHENQLRGLVGEQAPEVDPVDQQPLGDVTAAYDARTPTQTAPTWVRQYQESRLQGEQYPDLISYLDRLPREAELADAYFKDGQWEAQKQHFRATGMPHPEEAEVDDAYRMLQTKDAAVTPEQRAEALQTIRTVLDDELGDFDTDRAIDAPAQELSLVPNQPARYEGGIDYTAPARPVARPQVDRQSSDDATIARLALADNIEPGAAMRLDRAHALRRQAADAGIPVSVVPHPSGRGYAVAPTSRLDPAARNATPQSEAAATLPYDQSPSGRMLAGAAGVRPELRGEAVSAGNAIQQQRAELDAERQRRDELGLSNTTPVRPVTQPAPTGQPALAYDTTPTGNMVAGIDGVRREIRADVINRNQASNAVVEKALDQPLAPEAPAQAATETVAPITADNRREEPGSARIGRDQRPLAEGGKPFKTRKAAGDAKKLQPMMRVVTVDGGYALADKTPAQLAAEAKASKRLSNASTSPAGEPIPAHAFIAAAGGLNVRAKPDMGIDGNPRVGNRTLFAGLGKGLTIERATEQLVENGYLSEGASHNDAMALIKRSLSQPQYNADGIERIAEAETAARFEDYVAAQEDAFADGEPDPFSMPDDFTPDELEDVGYTAADPKLQAEVNALMAQVDAMGLDASEILEDIVRTYANASQDEFNAAAKRALEEAITRSSGDGGGIAAQTAAAAEPAEGLTAPTRDDVLAQQERAENAARAEKAQQRAQDEIARRERERKDIARASEAAADTFVLGGDAEQNLSGQGGMFDEQDAAPDGFGEKFTLTLNSLFQNVPYRASAPVPLATGESVVSTEIVPRKTAISKADQEEFGLPATVLAWRVSAIQHANGEFSARIEPMVKDYGRAPGGEVVAYFQDARGVADAIDRIAPSVSKIAIQAYETAKGAAGGQTPMFSRAKKAEPEERNLIITHNLTGDNLLHAVKMGGIAVPSLAVTRKDQALGNFGGITLLGTRDMADPKGYAGTKVYGADIYSPRYPSVQLELSPAMKKRGEAMLAKGMDALGRTYIDWSEVERDGVQEMERQAPVLWQFLESKGIEPPIVHREPQPLSKHLQPFASDTRGPRELAVDPAFVAAVWAGRRDVLLESYGGDAAAADAELADARKKAKDQDDNYLARRATLDVQTYQRELRQSGDVNFESTKYEMDKLVRESGLKSEFQAYAQELLASLAPNERMFQGYTPSGNRKYIPHTLENVVKILKKDLRGGEGFNYGVGSLRAKFTPEFKTLDAIRKEKGRLVTPEQFEAVKEEVNDELVGIAESLGLSLDQTIEVLEDAPKIGVPNAVARALRDYRSDVTADAETHQRIAQYLTRLKSLPTAYFEAKILRPVSLSEFAGAVVPEDVDPKVLDALRKAGVTNISTYPANNGKARQAAVLAMTEQLGDRAMFSLGDQNATRTPARKASDANLVATQQLVDGLKEKWTNAPEIIVARNMQDAQIPQPVRDYDQTLKSQGATGEARGFIYRGKVYLLADQLNGPHQIAEVLFHEVLGHYGLRRAFGKGLTPILQQVATMRRKEMQAKAKEYGLDLTNERDRLTAAEEILAEMAQATPEIGFVKRAIAIIRNWMRANVPGFRSLRLTDNDIIQAYILPARGAVTRSKETGLQSIERAMASFSRGTNKAVTNPNDVVGNQGGRSADDVTKGVRTAASQIVEAMAADEDADYALRVLQEDVPAVKTGDTLPLSRRWDDGNATDEELSGTSGAEIKASNEMAVQAAIRSLGAHRTGNNGYYPGTRIVLIKGERSAVGDDPGEVLLRNAEVVASWNKAGEDAHPIIPNESPASNRNDAPVFSRAPATDTPAFKKWFGDSQVVSADGKPLVVYHGTNVGINEFKPAKGLRSAGGLFESSATSPFKFFSPDKEEAQSYANAKGGHLLFSVYLRMERPLDSTTPDGLARMHRLFGSLDDTELSDWADSAVDLLDGIDELRATTPAEKSYFIKRDAKGRVIGQRATEREGYILEKYTAEDHAAEIERDLAQLIVEYEALLSAVPSSDAPLSVWAALDEPDSGDRLRAAGFDGLVFHENDGKKTFAVLDSTQIKSSTGNNENFDPANPDIRFSRSAPGGIAARAGESLKSVTATNIKERAGFKLTDYLGLGLQLLGRRQLVDIYGDTLPLDQYNRLAQQMEADKNEVGAEADALATAWAKLPDERQLAELMHDATLAQMDPAKPLVAGDNAIQHGVLRKRFNDLTPEAQKVYLGARDSYQAHHKGVLKAIKERIERSELKGPRKAALLAQMDDEFYKAVKGVYFPLARFGQYVVVTTGPDGKVSNVSRAETMNEGQATRKQMLLAFPASKGYKVGKVILSKEFVAGRDAVGRGFMTELYEVLDKQDMDAAARAELEDTLGQLYLSSLPDLSWAKHGIHRKGTPGYSQDARRAFAQNMFHGARYLAKLRYSDLMQDELTAMQKHVDNWVEVPDADFNSARAQRVVDEMNKRHESLMNPNSNPLSTALTSFGFIFHLGLSPASALVNLTQTALVAYPVMGAKWGFDKSAAALMKASQQAVQGKNDITGSLNEEERRAYDEAVRNGTIDVTMAHDLAGISQGEDAGVMWKIRPVMKWASFMFHHAERFNRQVTFVASYRLARAAGTAHEAAFEQATKATYDGHFDYSSANRPRVMQGNAARVLLLFKQYGQNMVYSLARSAQQSLKGATPQERTEARRVLGGLLAMHGMAAGALGLPMVTTLLAVASMLGGSDDEPWDAQVALQNMLADTFGQKPAEVLSHGLSRLTPWDISGRVGLDKLILPDIQEGLEGQRLGESAMAAALGPVAGIGINVLKGMQDMGNGHYLRGLESMLPAALRGPMKALRYADEGAQDKTGVSIQDEVSPAAIAGQAFGFSPSEVRLATEGKSAIMGADRALSERRQELLSKAARASMEKDAGALDEARKEIDRFNEKNPTRRITPLNIVQSVRNRNKRIDQAQDGVYLPKNRRDAMEAGRFAIE